MAANIGSVDVRDGDVEPSAGSADFLCGWDNSLRFTENLAHSVAAWNVPQSPMLDFAGGANDCAFAIALDNLPVSAKSSYQSFCHLEAERFEIIHKPGDFFYVTSRERIVNDRNSCGSAKRQGSCGTSFVEYLLHRN